MANTGYGQEKYGRSLYGALTYHDLEASVSANASISVAPSLNFSIPSQPINAIGSITSNISHIFANQDVGINPTTSVTTIGQKVNQGIPNAIIQNSGQLIAKESINKAALKFKLDHQRGSLAAVLNVMSDCQLNLTKIQSLPVIKTPGKYAFFVDVTFEDLTHYENN